MVRVIQGFIPVYATAAAPGAMWASNGRPRVRSATPSSAGGSFRLRSSVRSSGAPYASASSPSEWVESAPASLVTLGVRVGSLHLPTSPYTSLHPPTSPYISLHLPTSHYISLYLPTPPYISLHLSVTGVVYKGFGLSSARG